MNADARSSGVHAHRKFSGEHPATRDGGVVEIDFNLANPSMRDVNMYSRRDGDGEFKFLARDTVPPCVDNRPLLAAGKPELREYKCVYVQNDAEIGLFSDEVVVNCAP
jgi:hypothetical protein